MQFFPIVFLTVLQAQLSHCLQWELQKPGMSAEGTDP